MFTIQLKKAKKVTTGECVFVESAFEIQCYLHNNTLRHTAFFWNSLFTTCLSVCWMSSEWGGFVYAYSAPVIKNSLETPWSCSRCFSYMYILYIIYRRENKAIINQNKRNTEKKKKQNLNKELDEKNIFIYINIYISLNSYFWGTSLCFF